MLFLFSAQDGLPQFDHFQLFLPRLPATLFLRHQLFERRHFFGALEGRDMPCEPRPRVVFISVTRQNGSNLAGQFTRRY